MPILDTDVLDFLLDNNGDLVIQNGDGALCSGLVGVTQLIREAVLLVRGEWFMDLDAGLPWFERDGVPANEAILGGTFAEVKATQAFRDAILDVPGVDHIESISATYDGKTRQMTIKWVVVASFGDTITDSLTRGI